MTLHFDTQLTTLYREQLIAGAAENIVGDAWANLDVHDEVGGALLKRVWDYLGDRREIAFQFVLVSAGAKDIE